jgi:hypothetical protein
VGVSFLCAKANVVEETIKETFCTLQVLVILYTGVHEYGGKSFPETLIGRDIYHAKSFTSQKTICLTYVNKKLYGRQIPSPNTRG